MVDPRGVTEVASEVVGSLKASPTLLLILLLNLAMLGGLGYILIEVAAGRQKSVEVLQANQQRMYSDIMRLCFKSPEPDK
jgi:hypothetical protein